jgi:hypothetical protein
MTARAIGVYREQEFSPGKVTADAAILDAVLSNLAAQGIATSAVEAAEFGPAPQSRGTIVLAMCQAEPALDRLAQAQAEGALVFNSPQAIRSCYRDRLGAILKYSGAPVPDGMLIDTSAKIDRNALAPLDPQRGIYIKRGDLHALFEGDVRLANGEAALAAALREFSTRGIRHAYLQQAVEGKVVKFYGVTGVDYFDAAGAEVVISAPLQTRLKHAAQAAAEALGLEVWGGDAIVDSQVENFKIVDFNDWPSFERVRTVAAKAIAQRAIQKIENRK